MSKKVTFTVQLFTIDKNGVLKKRPRRLARPANIRDIDAFKSDFHGIQLACLYTKATMKAAVAAATLDNVKATDAAKLAARATLKAFQYTHNGINRAIDEYNASYDCNAPHTTAAFIALAIAPACRGMVDKENELTPVNAYYLYNVADNAYKTRNAPAAIRDAARREFHDAAVEFVNANTRDDVTTTYARAFAGKVKKATIDAALSNIAATHTTFNAGGINSKVLTPAAWSREFALLVMRDTFKFDDELTPAVVVKDNAVSLMSDMK